MADEFDTTTPGAILTRIEVKLDTALEGVKDHELRIRSLERRVWGASAVASLLAGGGAAALTKLLGG